MLTDTGQKKVTDMLRAYEGRFNAIVRNTPNVSIQGYDLEGRILFWNAASERIFGWPAEEAIGRTLDQLIFTEAEALAYLEILHQIKGSTRAAGPMEFRFRRRDGRLGWCLSTIFEIPAEGDDPNFVCMDVDITERKAAEDALKQVQVEALKAREQFTQQLISAQEQERKRLANEIHDCLGQNLSLIKNRVSVALSERDLPSNLVGHLEGISKVVADTLDEVRSLAQNLRPLPVDQVGLTDAIESLVERVAQSSAISFETHLENVDDLFPGGRATLVYRILQEALTNLVNHSQARHASVAIERDLRCVRIKVTDDGKGFNRQADGGAPRPPRSGIGLTSIDERVRMLGGSLVIASRPGDGTSILIETPCAENAALAPPDGQSGHTRD